MSKTRFAPWVVFACIGTLAGCTSGEGGTVGNTDLNIILPNGCAQDTSSPDCYDIQVVEYTIACDDGDPTPNGPFLDNNAGFDDRVVISGVLEVFDTPQPGRPGRATSGDPWTWGKDLGDIYVAQGFMDLPVTQKCSAQLRARDADGEYICSDTVSFDVAADTVSTVNVLMYCGLSFQADVAQLDLAADFSFNVSNFCPDLFVLNCIDSEIDVRSFPPPIGEVAATACQTRFRDGDSSCGGTGIQPGDPDGASSCDPQVCTTAPEGLRCAPDPTAVDPPVTTTVTCPPTGFFCAIPGPPLFGTPCTPAAGDTCFDLSGGAACVPNAVIDCAGTGNPAANCVFTGDTTGNIGDGPPGPLNPGEGGFFVACVLGDDDGDPTTPDVPLTPGAPITCNAVTTDGDVDCDKTKEVVVTCPGLSPCQALPPGTCDDGNDCTADSCDDSSGAAVCVNTDLVDGVMCTSAPAPATCQGGVCTSGDCNAQPDPDGSCDDGNECTIDSCNAPPAIDCTNAPNEDASCANGTGTCDANGACIDACTGVICDDGNECTDDPACDSSSGSAVCPPPVNDDENTCTTCDSGICLCSGGSCIDGCTIPAPVDAAGIPMACRNSFNQVVSTFPIDLLNVTAVDDTGAPSCIEDGQPVDFEIDPTIALDTAFLEAAAQTLCDLGTLLTEADVTFAQVSVDAVAGATCTEQLSVLPGTPVTVTIPTVCDGNCGDADVTCMVTSGISLDLPSMLLPCSSASAADGEVQICSTGQVPLSISLTDPAPPPTYQETYVGVDVGGGAIRVAFACNTSSTTNPPPGQENEIGCVLANPAASTPGGLSCADAVGDGDVGETPFPTSDCNTEDGPPTDPQTCDLFGNPTPCSGVCDTVPVGVDPSTVCATFKVQ